MMNESKYFFSYSLYSNDGKVFLVNGSFIPISGEGSISGSPSITLNLVLHVPKIACNLLLVSKITKSLNCCVKFYPTHCVFQDLITGKKIGNVEEKGLYYITPKVK